MPKFRARDSRSTESESRSDHQQSSEPYPKKFIATCALAASPCGGDSDNMTHNRAKCSKERRRTEPSARAPALLARGCLRVASVRPASIRSSSRRCSRGCLSVAVNGSARIANLNLRLVEQAAARQDRAGRSPGGGVRGEGGTDGRDRRWRRRGRSERAQAAA